MSKEVHLSLEKMTERKDDALFIAKSMIAQMTTDGGRLSEDDMLRGLLIIERTLDSQQ